MMKPLFIRQDKVFQKIDLEEVICLYTEGNYTKIFLSDKSYYLVRSSLSKAMKKLPSDIFIKIHRSYVASIYYIDNIARDHLLIGGEPVPIARQYYKSLMEKLNIIE